MTMRKLPPAVSRCVTTSSDQASTIVPRRYLRAPVNLPAQYMVDGDTGWRASIIDDLGGGGVRLQTPDDIAAGTAFVLRFIVDGTPITANARVAMSLYDRARASFIHGVAFTAIEPDARQTIVNRVLALSIPQRP